MASVQYAGTFGGKSGSNGLTATGVIVGSPLPDGAVITSVTYSLRITAGAYSSSKSWELGQIAVGGMGGRPSAYGSATMYSGEHTFSGDMSFAAADVSKFKGTEITVYAQAYTTHSSTSYLWDFNITVNYVVYSKTGAPTTVKANATDVAPGAKVTLSWSGAAAGDSNNITGYKIYRATSEDGTYSLLTSVGTNSTSGSTTVVAPSANGESYYYKVQTVGSASGYDSSLSSVFGTVTCSFASVGAPDTLRLSLTNVAPGAEATLSWSGATAGDNNPIVGYEIHRATSADGEYSLLKSVENVDSTTVTAPTLSGTTYYYKVKTKGTLAGSDSALSSVYTSLTCTYSAPNPPARVTVADQSNVYVKPDGMVVLSWSGATAGANNPIVGYDVYRDGEPYAEGLSVDADSLSVAVNATPGGSYSFTVVTKGAHSDSSPSAACVLYTYTDPTAPTELSVSTEVPVAGARVLLSWSGATPGGFNDIVGYKVYRANSEGGVLTHVTSVNSTDATQSCYVTAPSTAGAYYYFYVETLGSYSSSGASEVFVAVGAREGSDEEDNPIEVIVPPPTRRRKRGFVFGDYDTGLKGWTLNSWSFPEPEPQTNYVEVPGRIKGPLDRSTVLTGGDPRYGSRELTARFELSDGTRLERDAIISEMVNRLNGMREDIVFPDDPARYAVGRLHVEQEYSDMAHAAVNVTATCEPWRYSQKETRISILAFDNESTLVLSNGGRMVIVPDVVVTGYGARVTLVCGAKRWTLGTGSYRLPELALSHGNTVLTYQGVGTITFTYREAIL